MRQQMSRNFFFSQKKNFSRHFLTQKRQLGVGRNENVRLIRESSEVVAVVSDIWNWSIGNFGPHNTNSCVLPSALPLFGDRPSLAALQLLRVHCFRARRVALPLHARVCSTHTSAYRSLGRWLLGRLRVPFSSVPFNLWCIAICCGCAAGCCCAVTAWARRRTRWWAARGSSRCWCGQHMLIISWWSGKGLRLLMLRERGFFK